MKQIILDGFVAGIGMLGAGFAMSALLNLLFPAISHEYKNPQLFRSWSDPLMSLYFVHPFIVGFILAFIWGKVKKLFAGSVLSRGFWFGFIFWIAATFPGMFISYSSFPLSFLMISTWSVSGFVQEVTGGMILAKMNP